MLKTTCELCDKEPTRLLSISESLVRLDTRFGGGGRTEFGVCEDHVHAVPVLKVEGIYREWTLRPGIDA